MNNVLVLFFTAFLTGCGAALLFAQPVMRLLDAMRSKQSVSEYAPGTHQVKQGTPTMGGLMVLAGLAVALIPGPGGVLTLLWVLGFAAIGFADDFVVPRLRAGKRGLGWKQKIVPQAVLAGLGVPLLGLPATPEMFAMVAFVVLFFCNAYNFSDGLDGLAGTLGIVLATGLMLMTRVPGDAGWAGPVLFGQEWAALAMGAVAGSLVPFLFLNAHPARVFMGDVGSLPIGALLGLVVCRLLFGEGGEIRFEVLGPLAVVSCVMVVELVPVPLQVLWVKLFKKRLFPMTPLHHAFEKAGWPETRIVALFVLVQTVAVAIAVLVGLRA